MTSLRPISMKFSTSSDANSEGDIIGIIQKYLRANIRTSSKYYFEKIFRDIDRERNRVIRFSNTDESHLSIASGGTRVAYGAFRYRAFNHTSQKTWCYTFEIIDQGEYLSMTTNPHAMWSSDTDLSDKISNLLE
jgi:hypothetical protein